MHTTLVLVRHAHVPDNDCGPDARLCGWYDAPLSPLGGRQVARLCAALEAGPRPAALYTSPLQRARQTAEGVAAVLGIPAVAVAGLREINCGELDGLPLVEVQRQHPDIWARNMAQTDDEFRWPGGESYREFRTRVLQTARHLSTSHPGERILIVTHAGVISQILGAIAGASAARWEDFRPGNASITSLRWNGSLGTVLRFGERRHLEGLSGP
jgi:broad specificity phosphatase PhoE